MLVHLGDEVVVDVRQVVAILDARRLQRTAEARNLLDRAVRKRSGELVARAVIVTTRGVFSASISPETVAKRIGKTTHLRGRKTARR